MDVSSFVEVAGVPAFEWVPTCFTRLELVFPQRNNRGIFIHVTPWLSSVSLCCLMSLSHPSLNP